MTGSRTLRNALLLPFALVIAAGGAAAKAEPATVEAELIDRLRDRIERQAAALDGVAGVYVEDLTSGATIAIRADTRFAQASAIKVPILFELLARADEKSIDLDRRARRPAATGMGGILENLSPEAELSARDLAVLMIVQSDNGATNELIDRLGLERVTARMAALGLPHTLLRRKMLDTAAAKSGRENVSTPREMAVLAKRVHDRRGLSKASADELRRLLGVWSSDPFRNGIGEGAGAAVFEKPGELPGVRTSVALVELPKRAYVVAIATAALADDLDGDTFVTTLSRAIFETFDRIARMNEAGRFVN
jgi:beta-lactamase class A